ncbi:MAG TPA: hypothetical protein VNO31_50410, partial [Umezawaea sp.]|nr:hypothetical protein [Umezawaea sp.]
MGYQGAVESAESERALTMRAPHSGPVTALAALRRADGRAVLVSGSNDGGVRRWDAVTGEALDEPHDGRGWVWSAAVASTRDGRSLVVGGFHDGRLVRWDADSGKPVDGEVRTGWVRSLAVVGEVVFGGSDDGEVRRWDLTTGLSAGDPLPGRPSSVWSLATVVRAGGTALLVGGFADGALWRWDVETGQPVGEPVVVHTGPVRALAVVGSVLYSASDDGTMGRWDVETGLPVGDPITATVLSLVPVAVSDGRTVLVGGGRDGRVLRWDGDTGLPIGEPLAGHRGPVRALAAIGSDDGRALVFSGA